MALTAALEALVAGHDLSRPDAAALMASLLDEGVSSVQKSAVLTALRIKGATADELAGFVEVLRSAARMHDFGIDALVDTCGTGGGRPSFNLSTGAAFLAAGAGVKVAKHGNRGVTSKCGSADVLEALGVVLTDDEAVLKRRLEEAGFTFFFAPAHHSSLKSIGPVRKELGIRTVFNQLGPLLNPAGARRQLIGIYDPEMGPPMAEALLMLGAEKALVVHGQDSLDEISPGATTDLWEVSDGAVTHRVVTPQDFGVAPVPSYSIEPGADAAESAALLVEAIADPGSERFSALVPNAAAAVWLAGLADDFASAADRVRQSASEGHPIQVLEKLRSLN